MRFYLTDLISRVYNKIDDDTVELKGGFLSLCADIDRFFLQSFGIDLTKIIVAKPEESFYEIFPNLSALSLDQLAELQKLFCEIRNINAHLYLSHSVKISAELCSQLTEIAAPQYQICVNGELTMYGSIYVLSFLCQKYNLWPFLTECMRSRFFLDIAKKQTSQTQQSMQRHLQTVCGLGKPIFIERSGITKIEQLYANDTCKRYMTKIFFGIEKCILKRTFPTKDFMNFAYLLYNNEPFSDAMALTNSLISLRNCWFHGKKLFDNIREGKRTFDFTPEYIVSVFVRLREVLLPYPEYSAVIRLINGFGRRLIDYYVLRVVEVSYKLLDNRLLTEDKLESRIEGAQKALQRLESVDPAYYELVVQLLDSDAITFSVKAPKFLDCFPRKTITQHLKILRIHSQGGFQIGAFFTPKTELCIAAVDLPEEYQNRINGKALSELQGEERKIYSPRIGVYELQMDAT